MECMRGSAELSHLLAHETNGLHQGAHTQRTRPVRVIPSREEHAGSYLGEEIRNLAAVQNVVNVFEHSFHDNLAVREEKYERFTLNARSDHVGLDVLRMGEDTAHPGQRQVSPRLVLIRLPSQILCFCLFLSASCVCWCEKGEGEEEEASAEYEVAFLGSVP